MSIDPLQNETQVLITKLKNSKSLTQYGLLDALCHALVDRYLGGNWKGHAACDLLI